MKPASIFWLLAAILFAGGLARAQVVVGNYGVQYAGTAPSGACANNAPLTVLQPSGTTYVCQNGTWGVAGGIPFLSGNGFVEWCMASGAGTSFNCFGDSLSNSTGNTTASCCTATSVTPLLLQGTSDTTTGHSAGWASNTGSNFVPYYSGRQPTLTFGIGYSNATDFNANALINFGLVQSTCTVATLTASNNPSGCAYAAIQWSTVRGDTHYQCVTQSGTGTNQTVTDIGVAPATTFTPMSISIGASSVTCTVGGTSVSNTTNLPANNIVLYDAFLNTIASGTTATHIRMNGVYGFSRNGTY